MGGWFSGRRGSVFYSAVAIVAVVVAVLVFFGARAIYPGLEFARQGGPVESLQAVLTASGGATTEQAPEAPEVSSGDEPAGEAATENAGSEAAVQATRGEAERRTGLAARLEAERAAAEQYAAEQAAAQAAVERNADSASPFPPALAAPSSTTFYLTVPKLGLYNVSVIDDTSEVGLSQGAGHLPGTGFPWIAGSNTYVAGHRLGYAGTPSDRVFYDLPSLAAGDEVIVTDSNGRSYTYVVSEILEVSPYDLSVTAPIPGRDVLTLQTCIEDFGDYWTPGPNWLARYVVRADLAA